MIGYTERAKLRHFLVGKAMDLIGSMVVAHPPILESLSSGGNVKDGIASDAVEIADAVLAKLEETEEGESDIYTPNCSGTLKEQDDGS